MPKRNHLIKLGRLLVSAIFIASLSLSALGQTGEEEAFPPQEEEALPQIEEEAVAARLGDGEDHTTPYIYNVARASSGAVATASSYANSPPYYQPPAGAINGDRKGLNWWSGTGGWADNTPGAYPDWFEVRFANAKKVNEIDLFTLQDDNLNPVEPTPENTFALYGLVNFQIQYWNGSGWVTLADVVNNNKVWTKFTFPTVTTSRIRVYITAANYYSRIVELEAWGTDALEVAPLPVGVGGCPGVDLNPCELTWDLYQAMQGVLPRDFSYGNGTGELGSWTRRMDWKFRNWGAINGSLNLPVLSHAIALWVPPIEYGHAGNTQALMWWNTFLDCQNGNCVSRANSANTSYYDGTQVRLPLFKGNEIFSVDYDTATTIAVISVRQWAIRETIAGRDQRALALKAALYLRNTWIFYALAAGQYPVTKIKNRFSQQWQNCQPSDEVPYLALAGMRSPYYWFCGNNVVGDARAFLFERAARLQTGSHQREPLVNRQILDYLQGLPPDTTVFPAESVFGLTREHRDLIKRIVNGTNGTTRQQLNQDINYLVSFVAPIKTIVTYQFLAFETTTTKKQIRVTLMDGNRNPNTAAIMSVVYDGSGSSSNGIVSGQLLYPYSNKGGIRCEFTNEDWNPARKEIRQTGYGRFLPPLGVPTMVETSNESIGAKTGGSCVHEDKRPIVDKMNLPANLNSSNVLYHIVLSPTAPPRRIFY